MQDASKGGKGLLGRNIIFWVLFSKQFCNIVNGSIYSIAYIPPLCLRMLKQIYVGITEVIQVDELALLYDRVMSFIPCTLNVF